MKRAARAVTAVFVSGTVACGSGGTGAPPTAPASESRFRDARPALPERAAAASSAPGERDGVPTRPETLRGSGVLSVTAGETEAAPGSAGEWVVHLHIGPGYHVLSNHPSSPNTIPTSVEVSGPSGVKFGEPLYPPGTTSRPEDQEERAFRGDVDVAVPFTVDGSIAEGQFELRGKVHYQACTEGRCLFPSDEPFRGTLRIFAKP